MKQKVIALYKLKAEKTIAILDKIAQSLVETIQWMSNQLNATFTQKVDFSDRSVGWTIVMMKRNPTLDLSYCNS